MTAPRLSVVLVVYRDQAYLRECVLSVLDQAPGDLELVAVDDASPDHGPEILEELAAADPRLVIRRLDRTVSQGEARNVGLDAARGDFVWFVEGTDLLTPESVGAVLARLAETRPDVLLVDHERAPVLGKARPGPYRRALRAAATRETFTLEESPALAGMATPVWDKIFRREFLDELGVRFAPGRFGDLPVGAAALLTGRLSALARVCYVRREPPNATEDPHVHGIPSDVAEQYDRLFRFVDSRADVPAARRRLVPPRMLRHFLEILRELPENRRPAFFARISASYRLHARGDERLHGRRLRVQTRLVERGAYRAFRALEWAAHQKRAAPAHLDRIRHHRRRLRRGGRGSPMERYYRSSLRRPIDPNLAVFASYWYRGYLCNPRAIYEKLGELAPWIRGVWIVNEQHVGSIPAGVEHVVAGTREYYDLIARAKYFVNNVNFPNDLVKREGTIHVQTHHGSPLKTMGLDLRDAAVARSRMKFAAFLRRCARWDYFISSNTLSTITFERVFPGRYETLEVGYPRNDALANATGADVARIRDELGIAPGRRVVLYAPTHREYLKGYVPTLDLGRLADGLGSDTVVLARLHYFYGDDPHLRDLHAAGRVLDVSRHPSIEELSIASDALVTDYSSLMFDYAVLDRPIVIYAPDWDEYRRLRGTYFDLLAQPPGSVTTTEKELVDAFGSDAVRSEEAGRLRDAFRQRFCTLDDGRAAERVVRRVWLSEATPATEVIAQREAVRT